MSPLDNKALAAITLLWDRKDTWSVITYGDLAKRLGHAPQGLAEILNRVGAWCHSVHKQSLAMLVIGAHGEPNEGMFRPDPGDDDPVTKENYERRRVALWREQWDGITLPTPEEIAAAYDKSRGAIITYLIWSQDCFSRGQYWTADVPTDSGGRREVRWTARTDDPSSIDDLWPDNVIVWQGAARDIHNIQSVVRQEPM